MVGISAFNYGYKRVIRQSGADRDREHTVRKLILVRHSLPEMVPDLPANQWRLSDTGHLRCKGLAERLAAYDPDVIVASLEPKATETGRIVANILGKPFKTAVNLHEHDRSNVSPFGTKQQFEAQVARFFENPQIFNGGRCLTL